MTRITFSFDLELAFLSRWACSGSLGRLVLKASHSRASLLSPASVETGSFFAEIVFDLLCNLPASFWNADWKFTAENLLECFWDIRWLRGLELETGARGVKRSFCEAVPGSGWAETFCARSDFLTQEVAPRRYAVCSLSRMCLWWCRFFALVSEARFFSSVFRRYTMKLE